MIKRITVLLVSIIFPVILSIGCVAKGPTGRWQQNQEAQKIFTSATVLQNHTYYYTGQKARPDAIIAVDNAYKLQSDLWIAINVTPKLIKEWLAWYKSEFSVFCTYRGGYILTPDQQVAGIWYSKELLNTIYSPEPGVVEVYLPYSASGSKCDERRFGDDL